MRIIGFEEDYVEKVVSDGNGGTRVDLVSNDWVTLAPDGASSLASQTRHRIRSIDPSLAPAMRHGTDGYKAALERWDIVKPHYTAWKTSATVPIEGTPLAVWGGISKAIVEALKPYGVLTVEQVRDMPDDMIKVIQHPDAARMPKLAAQFLEGKDAASLAAEKDEIAAENEAIKARLAEMEAMLKAQNATKTAPPQASEDAPRRGPGRPRKEASTEAAA